MIQIIKLHLYSFGAGKELLTIRAKTEDGEMKEFDFKTSRQKLVDLRNLLTVWLRDN